MSAPFAAQFRAFLSVAAFEARHAFSQPRLLASLFLLPVMFSSLLAVFQTGYAGPIRMLWTAPDTGFTRAVRESLERTGVQLETADGRATSLIARDERDLWVRFPKDTAARLERGEPVKVSIVVTNNTSPRAFDGELELRAAIARWQAPQAARDAVLEAQPDASEATLADAERRTRTRLEDRVFAVEREYAQAERGVANLRATGATQTTPGMTLMFALLFGAQTGLALQRDRLSGTLARLFASPVGWPSVVAGKMLGNAIVLIVQLAAMVAFSSLVFHVRWGNYAVLAVPAIAFAIASSAFGGFCATVTQTPAQLNSLSTLAVTVSAALGGMWWPLEVVPDWMQTVARALPTFWAMDAFQNVMLRNAGLLAVLPHTLILLGFAALLTIVGSRIFRYE